jgi:hypothetical protein
MDLIFVYIIFVSTFQNCKVGILLTEKLHITEFCRLLKLQEIWRFQS